MTSENDYAYWVCCTLVFLESQARGHKSTGKKRGPVTYSTDRENEVSKIFIISLKLIQRAGKETSRSQTKVQLPQRLLCQNPKN